MMGMALLRFINSLRGGRASEYNRGYNAALDDIEEWARDQMWSEGEDEDEGS